ncbi:MAG TPA: hypothetical protein VFZ47_06755 [Chitinophagaceae bacterium]
MKKFALLSAFVMLTTLLPAQRRTIFSIGPELSVSTDREIPTPGIGASIGMEVRSFHRISFTSEISYNQFSGDVIYKFRNDTIQGFSKLPIVAGIKGRIWKGAYLVVRAGLAFGLKNAGTSLAFAPGAGWLLHRNDKPLLDLGVRWIGIPGMPSFPENSVLNKGGYSYLNFRVAYVF